MVEVYVPFPQPFTVKLVNSYNDSIVYDQKTVTPYQSGYVNVTLVVPKELRELTYFDGILTVNLSVGHPQHLNQDDYRYYHSRSISNSNTTTKQYYRNHLWITTKHCCSKNLYWYTLNSDI